MNGDNANNVLVSNSVFYLGEKFLINALDSSEWTITNNLLIGALLRPGAPSL